MTQNERILRHLQEVGAISPLTAWREHGVYRLASRISDLKKQGHNIQKKMVKTTNKYGEAVSFAEYSLMEE